MTEQDLAKRTNGQLVTLTKGEEQMLGMFSTDAIGLALEASDFEVSEEIESLLDIARNGEEDGTRLRAWKQLNERVKQAMDLNGLTVTGRMTVKEKDDEGHDIEVTRVQTRLITALSQGVPDVSDASSHLARRTKEPIAVSARSRATDPDDGDAGDADGSGTGGGDQPRRPDD
jgi:hypothetical protein